MLASNASYHEIRAEAARALEVLHSPGDVVELRALKDKETVSGYFDDHRALLSEAFRLETQSYSIYITLNRIDAALRARSSNKVKRRPKATTSDADVVKRQWLPVDLDPVRPSGISATKEEKRAALLRARDIRDWLRSRGWPDPVIADSGNGAHLLYRIDLPNDRQSSELVRRALEALSVRFDDEAVAVDTGVHNAARIWKLYGTTARKGDDTTDRPHRRSRILKVPSQEVTS